MTKLNSLYNAFIKQAGNLVISNNKNKNPLLVGKYYQENVIGKHSILPSSGLYSNDDKNIKFLYQDEFGWGPGINNTFVDNNLYGGRAVEVDENFNKKFNDRVLNNIKNTEVEGLDKNNNKRFKQVLFKEHKRIMNYLNKNKINRFHLAS